MLKLMFRRMFLTKFIKTLLLFALFASACRFWQAKPDAAAQPTPATVEVLKNDAPFATKEPENYQTEIVVTANDVENVMFAARNGESRLIVYDYQKKTEFALLQAPDGSFTFARNLKIYTANQTNGNYEITDDFPTAELLNAKSDAAYESLGTENNSAKYRIRLNESKSSETVVTVDQTLNLPVKQEFYSVSGEQKTPVSTVELRDFKLRTDAQTFALPKDYKKVSPDEFQQTLQRERLK